MLSELESSRCMMINTLLWNGNLEIWMKMRKIEEETGNHSSNNSQLQEI
jgi:hypothetical protein